MPVDKEAIKWEEVDASKTCISVLSLGPSRLMRLVFHEWNSAMNSFTPRDDFFFVLGISPLARAGNLRLGDGSVIHGCIARVGWKDTIVVCLIRSHHGHVDRFRKHDLSMTLSIQCRLVQSDKVKD